MTNNDRKASIVIMSKLFCLRLFKSHIGLYEHKQAKHALTSRQNFQFCYKGFLSKPYFTGHMNSHLQSKTFTCSNDHCGYKTNLMQHLKTCSGSTKVQCNQCPLRLSTPFALRDHMKVAHSLQLIPCVCGKNQQKCIFFLWSYSTFNLKQIF